MQIDLTPMQYVIAALANAQAEGLSVDDLLECAIHAKDAEAFDRAVNLLAMASGNARAV